MEKKDSYVYLGPDPQLLYINIAPLTSMELCRITASEEQTWNVHVLTTCTCEKSNGFHIAALFLKKFARPLGSITFSGFHSMKNHRSFQGYTGLAQITKMFFSEIMSHPFKKIGGRQTAHYWFSCESLLWRWYLNSTILAIYLYN